MDFGWNVMRTWTPGVGPLGTQVPGNTVAFAARPARKHVSADLRACAVRPALYHPRNVCRNTSVGLDRSTYNWEVFYKAIAGTR